MSSARAIWVSPSPNIRAPVDRRRLRAHDDAEAFGTPPPWELTTYFSKKKTRIVQKNGELLDDFSVMHELTREQRFGDPRRWNEGRWSGGTGAMVAC